MSGLNAFVSELETIIHGVLEETNLPEKALALTKNKSGAYSLWLKEPMNGLKSQLILSILQKGRSGSRYLCMAVKTQKLQDIPPPKDVEIKTIQSDKLNSFLTVPENSESVLKFSKDLILDCVKKFEPSEKFGCCSRYKECSAAKKCLHPDLFYAKACLYRKNLENGNIFY